MKNRFYMSVEENILYAKRNIIDSIWKEANIEGIGVTFPETQEIYEGRAVAGLSVDDTIAINNLKHAWQLVFDTINVPVDLTYIRQVNTIIGQGGIIYDNGNLHNSIVSIGGTDWRPELLDCDDAKKMVESIMNREPGQERALRMFLALCRAQLFNDGNKRTAQLVANKMLIADGAGIFAIPVKEKQHFSELLVNFYETGEDNEILSFLAEKGMDGTDTGKHNITLETESHSVKQAADILNKQKDGYESSYGALT